MVWSDHTTPTYMICRGNCLDESKSTAQQSRTGSPTCRRLSPDFALFPNWANGFQDTPTRRPSPKSRSRPHQPIGLADDTLGGRLSEGRDRCRTSLTFRSTTAREKAPRDCAPTTAHATIKSSDSEASRYYLAVSFPNTFGGDAFGKPDRTLTRRGERAARPEWRLAPAP